MDDPTPALVGPERDDGAWGSSGFGGRLRQRREIALCAAHSAGRVLTLGPGTLAVTRALQEAGFEVTMHGGTPGAPVSLPHDAAAFDTVIACGLEALPVQPEALWAECSRVVRPGGKVILALKRSSTPGEGDIAPERYLLDLAGSLAALGASVTHVIPYGAFDENPALRKRLGTAYDGLIHALREAFQAPGALELWSCIEDALFPHLPVGVSSHWLVLAEAGAARAAAWRPPSALEPGGEPFDAVALATLLGPHYAEFRAELHECLRPEGAIQLLVELNCLLGPHLPVAVDFLPILDPDTRTRFLDQLAWRWTRTWHFSPVCEVFAARGMPVLPLLEYPILEEFMRALKPLAKGIE